MDLFSTNSESAIERTINYDKVELSVISEDSLVKTFDLLHCVSYIKDHGYSKVCLQFPDSLLQYSVQVALWIEKHINNKVFILGDTSYGSCCVDEVAAEHIEGDLVIHMGHACLSPTSRLPVLYVLPEASLNLSHLFTAFIAYANEFTGPVLILYDVAFSQFSDEIKSRLSQAAMEADIQIVVSQLCIPGRTMKSCGNSCVTAESISHQTMLLGRAFCCTSPGSIVYIAHKHSQNMHNFALAYRDIPMYMYKEGNIESMDFNKTLRRRLYLVEQVKDAECIGIVVGTLSVDKYLGAIDRVKKLAKYRGKRCYIISVGKPNPAKLANFAEVNVFVLVSCPEACIENEKDYYQPVVTLLEVELALNSERKWDDPMSLDFRDLLEGGSYHKQLPAGREPLTADVSLISNKIRLEGQEVPCLEEGSSQLVTRGDYTMAVSNSYYSERSWKGLEPALGETPISIVTRGRSGIPMGYDNEKEHEPS